MPKAQVQLIAEYSQVYKKDLPTNIAELLPRESTKLEMIGMVVYAANRIQPRISKYLDYSFKTQNQLLTYYLQLETNTKVISLFKNILLEEILIFNRPANLYAITTILNSDLRFDIDDSTRNTADFRSFLSFYLACNEVVVSFDKKNPELKSTIESVSANFMATEEYNLDVDPIFALYRGKMLLDFIRDSEKYRKPFNDYLSEIGVSAESYFKEIRSLCFSEHAKGNEDEFRFSFPPSNFNPLLKYLSKRSFPLREENILEARHIRKSPFLEIGENQFFLLDSYILIEKACEGLIWDFLFEKLLLSVADSKEREAVIKDFKGEIGRFYERYLSTLIRYSFHHVNNPSPKLFDDLLHGGDEFADIYIRQKSKILIGQVKSSSIPASSKFGDSASFLYNENRKDFFKTHGLYQLIKSIRKLFELGKKFDTALDSKKSYTIFPILVTNEKALITGFFPEVFQKEFNAQLKETETGELRIRRLHIMHVSDWENLCELFKNRKLKLFRLLEQHEANYSLTLRLSLTYKRKRTLHPAFIKEEISDKPENEIEND